MGLLATQLYLQYMKRQTDKLTVESQIFEVWGKNMGLWGFKFVVEEMLSSYVYEI